MHEYLQIEYKIRMLNILGPCKREKNISCTNKMKPANDER